MQDEAIKAYKEKLTVLKELMSVILLDEAAQCSIKVTIKRKAGSSKSIVHTDEDGSLIIDDPESDESNDAYEEAKRRAMNRVQAWGFTSPTFSRIINIEKAITKKANHDSGQFIISEEQCFELLQRIMSTTHAEYRILCRQLAKELNEEAERRIL